MREHMGLYRGKRVDNGEWAEGFYYVKPESNAFASETFSMITTKDCYYDYEVDPYTVGECTGLADKNGKLIFEGDILKGMRGLHRVYYDTSLACFEWAKINGNWEESFSGFADEYEIIGNVHDNPELMERSGRRC